MDKKILMLGLVISGNVFGMNDNTDFSEQYRSQSPENKIERKYHYDKCKLDCFSGIFVSLESHPYGFQLRMDRVHNELVDIMKTPVNMAGQLVFPMMCLFSRYNSVKNFFKSEYYSEKYNKTFLMLFKSASLVFNEFELTSDEENIVNFYNEQVKLLDESNIIKNTSGGHLPSTFAMLSNIIEKRIIWD